MSKKQFVLGVALLATLAWTGSSLALFHDYFPTGADGSMNTYPDEGYATVDIGIPRMAKSSQHFGFFDFRTEYSDGPDGAREGFNDTIKGQDKYDGWFLGSNGALTRGNTDPASANAYGPSPAWYAGKKVIAAYMYFRQGGTTGDLGDFCNANAPANNYFSEPITVIGFRSGNVGSFNDLGYRVDKAQFLTDGVTPNPTYLQAILAGYNGGCCAGYNAPVVYPGEVSSVAWRMGLKSNQEFGSYPAKGDIGTSGNLGSQPVSITAEFWKVSSKDPNYANTVLQAIPGTPTTFDPDGDGLGGFSGPVDGSQQATDDNMFAFLWLMRKSTAHLINTTQLTKAACSGQYGRVDPRNVNGEITDGGWYAIKIDRTIVQGLAAVDDDRDTATGAKAADDRVGGIKAIVFNGLGATPSPADNAPFYSRDHQSSHNGRYGAYLDLTATYLGDVGNDGLVSVADLQAMVASWAGVGNPDTGVVTSGSYNFEADFNLDGYVNVGDLQQLVANWGEQAPAGGF